MASNNRTAKEAVQTRSRTVIVVVLAVAMAIGCAVGGTVAWLVSAPEPVVNTFTYGDINIDLDETDTLRDDDNNPDTNTYMMMPGIDIAKDPKVTVFEGSEACWLFVKLEESENFADFMTYEAADGWLPLEGEDGVYYRRVDAVTEDTVFGVLKDDVVSVLPTVTKEDLNSLDPAGVESTYPTLTITAYAVQYQGFEAEGGAAATNSQLYAAAKGAWEAMQAQMPPAPAEPAPSADPADDGEQNAPAANVPTPAPVSSGDDDSDDSILTVDAGE